MHVAILVSKRTTLARHHQYSATFTEKRNRYPVYRDNYGPVFKTDEARSNFKNSSHSYGDKYHRILHGKQRDTDESHERKPPEIQIQILRHHLYAAGRKSDQDNRVQPPRQWLAQRVQLISRVQTAKRTWRNTETIETYLSFSYPIRTTRRSAEWKWYLFLHSLWHLKRWEQLEHAYKYYYAHMTQK